MKFSLIVAATNEAAQIGSGLKRLRQISSTSPVEIILVDGGSSDGTAAEAREWADKVLVQEQPNRGAQLDAGARAATGDLLLFLPADAQPPGNWQQALEHFWLAPREKKIAATAFTVDYGSGWSFRVASALANAAARWGMIGIDHGLCTTPELYREAKGYPPQAYREDLVLSERLAHHGEIVILKEHIWPAARRMHRIGLLRSALQEGWLGLRYKLGASPDDLWRSYSGE